VPALDARVTPSLACLRRCRFQPGSESPRSLLSPCIASDVGLGFPLVLHLRLYRRWISGRPDVRIFRRCRAASTQVALSISLSVSPTIRRLGCPALRTLRHRLMDIRVTPDHAPIGLPWLKFRVAPVLLPWLRQLTNFQVALNLGSLTVRRFTALRVAPKFGSSADPYLLPRVSPFSASTAESMMSPWLDRTLHPQLALRMNLRVPFRSQYSLIWVPAYFSILAFRPAFDIAADCKLQN